MKKYLNAFVLVLVLFLSITLITGCTSTKDNKSIGLGETFIFDELEITLGKDISFTKIDNEYSDYYGKTVVKLPITVKNLKDETHSLNMFYYNVFGASGTETKSVTIYFDDGIDEAGDLRTGASYTKYMYFIYDQDGEYAIEFDDFVSKVTVEFDVKK